MTPRLVDRLVRIVEEHPGNENVELHLVERFPDIDHATCKAMLLNVYVDGSPGFLLKAMGLLD